MIWFHSQRTCIGNPSSSAKPAETFSPSKCPDHQCGFALYQQLTTVRLAYLTFRYKDPKCWFNLLCCMLPSPPVQCVVCLTDGSWGLQLPQGSSLWCSHLTCHIKVRGQVCLPPEGIWITLWLGTCSAGRGISEVRGLLPEISSGGCLKTFFIHWITPILQDDTDNRGKY